MEIPEPLGVDRTAERRAGWEQGFRDGAECVALANLEAQILRQRKTLGQLAELCYQRHGLTQDTDGDTK